MIDFPDTPTRRMPVYLLLDVSGSMAGARIAAVEQGVQMLHNELMGLPQAVELVHLSVITFADSASQINLLTPITSFKPPTLSAAGSTSMGAAFHTLAQALDREIILNSAGKKGDFKPLIFLLTDGEPTDNWQAELNALKARSTKKPGTIIALGCGEDVNMATLRAIADVALLMVNASPDNLKAFFKWVSQSVSAGSIQAGAASGADVAAAIAVPPADSGFIILPL
jgi:uncharacterized protein YegL